MSLIGQYLRQHTVEFIPGTGMVFDGVRTDATSLNGPWTWQTPDGTTQGELDGCGAGAGGGGGSTSAAEAAGGGGGGAGMCVGGVPINWAKGAILTITIGAAGTGGAAGAAGTQGGATIISGLLTNQYGSLPMFNTTGEMQLFGGGAGAAASTSASGAGGYGGKGAAGAYGLALSGAAVNNAATAANGAIGSEYLQSFFGIVYAQGGSSGGNASTSVTTAGGNGITWTQAGGRFLNTNWGFNGWPVATGGQNGTVSWGGGGGGAPSLFGLPGVSASGLAGAGGNATGYGAGGSGGNGQGAGGNGSPGYAKITYWSAD